MVKKAITEGRAKLERKQKKFGNERLTREGAQIQRGARAAVGAGK